jgi:hypothetical protein
LDVAIALGANDLAVLFKAAEGLLEGGLVAWSQAQAGEQLIEVGGRVIAPAQQT